MDSVSYTGKDNYRLLASDRVDSVRLNTGKNNYRLLASDRVDSVRRYTGKDNYRLLASDGVDLSNLTQERITTGY